MYFCVLDDVLHVVVYNSQVGLQNSPQTSFMPKERSERSGKDAFWTIIMIDAVLRLTVQVTARRERGAENPPKLQTGFKDWLRWCVSSGTCGFLHQIITLHPVSSLTRLCYEPNQKKRNPTQYTRPMLQSSGTDSTKHLHNQGTNAQQWPQH